MFTDVALVATSTPRPIDFGRVLMVPFSVVFGGLALVEVTQLLRGDGGSPFWLVSAVLASSLTAAFYFLIVHAYLRRGQARATSQTRMVLVAAPVATFLPFGLPFVASGGARTAALVAGELLLLVGFAYSVWAVRSLDRSLSMVPQARALVDHGPYATVRHPLYLGELVAMLGLAVTMGGPWPLVLWVVLALLQAYRAVQEERLLAAHLPDYTAYQARTARIVPGLF